jgi:hypothetical protein
MDVNNAYENKGHSKQANVYAQSTLIQFCKHLMLCPVETLSAATRASSAATRASSAAPTKRAASPARDSMAPKRATLDRGELRIYRSFLCQLI